MNKVIEITTSGNKSEPSKCQSLEDIYNKYLNTPITNASLYDMGWELLMFFYEHNLPEPYFIMDASTTNITIHAKDKVTPEQYKQCVKFGTAERLYYEGKKPTLVMYREVDDIFDEELGIKLERINL